MKHYTDERIKFKGFVLSPVTDVLEETKEGYLINKVADQKGSLYIAFYTKNDLKMDFWKKPFKLEKVK